MAIAKDVFSGYCTESKIYYKLYKTYVKTPLESVIGVFSRTKKILIFSTSLYLYSFGTRIS